MKGLGNKGLKEAVIFGAGLTIGFIIVSGGIKLLDKASGGGYIPDEFVEATPAESAYGGTMNSLTMGETGEFGLY